MLVGYARVSTSGQTLEAQIAILEAAGVQRIYKEKASAKDRDRTQLKKLLYAIRPGDTVLVSKLDRLARSLRDLLNIIHEVGDAGATFKSLGDPMWDTTTSQGRLVAQILGAVAEFERALTNQRTSDGRKRAQQYGTKSGRPFGRPRKMSPQQILEALERRKSGETLRSIGERYGLSESSVCRLMQVRLSADEAIAAIGNGIRRGH